ncbi:Cache 3/Cache 2 fusion domain-containing protein [Clostridium sp.]|uniref:Cache 3/Cache 2 fusion domain-containing protein n=1 Tax=Clostridium sp. TaxID=1506 RepID=UPI002848FCE5|nr:Cache 3/Cache 2 fusion domain-containing protein [Clostridium sp.]MDR3594413.1 Cache 3/Cache 2 fusion domain-containing protein [Clostridium sp.]
MRIKYKLMISYLILIVFAVSVLGFLIAKKSNDAILKEVNEKSRCLTESINTTLSVRNELLTEKSYGDLNFANTLLNNLVDLRVDYNESIKIGEFNLPVLYAGNQRLSLDSTIPDELKQSTGTVATIFLLHDDKLIRVSSTIFRDDDRVIGTYIPSDSEAYKKIINNEEYIGDLVILGNGYVTRMKPLLDKDKKVIGAIGIGNKILNQYLEETLSNIRLGETGYAYVIDTEGNVIIHPSDEGKNVSDYDFVQKMYSSYNGIIEYTYNGVKKVAYYQYFEPWHWYIVTTANYDELNSASISILRTTVVTGAIIIILGGLIALFLANALVKPINKLKTCMEIAGKGDLTVRCNIDSKDEIGILANSFNNMIAENKRLLEEAVQYDKLKTEFIANMSHELRTPLNIIFSTAQLFNVLISKGEDINIDKIRNYIDSMKQNCYRLIRLVNNLIDMTKIDSGYMKIELRNQDIVQIAEEITQSTVEYVEYMSRRIIFDTDQEEKIMAFDDEKLERILLNLISNATKFTEPGDKINVTLYDKGDHIIISVKDTGRGIPEDKLSQLFERFTQVDSLLSRNHEGSGIGLSIVKSLVEMHDGTIEVKSKYGEGTEFIICLPAKIISEEHEAETIKDYEKQADVENINIEFSDIYK